ncbi:MAG: type II toxin-antitoxin system Phd/YefM family antitoxin [Anaerolineales bacterium]|nr:type II toxin-antitoxin system Phd/YefM family antitoxin [Anaerolineales bacterium]
MDFETTTVTELQAQTSQVLGKLTQVGKIMVVRGTKAEAYLLSVAEYEQITAAFEALRDLGAGKTRNYREIEAETLTADS